MEKIACVTATAGRRPETLLRTVKSIEERKGYEWQVDHYIVNDGGDKEGISEEVRERVFKVIERKERGGPGAARNSALRVVMDSDYDFIQIIDDDDWNSPYFFSDLVRVIKDFDVTVAYGDLSILNWRKNPETGELYIDSQGPQFSQDWIYGLMKERPYIPLPACLFKTEFFREYGLFREDIGKCLEYELLARGEANGATFMHLKKICGFAEWKWIEGTDNISAKDPEQCFPSTSWSRIRTLVQGHYI